MSPNFQYLFLSPVDMLQQPAFLPTAQFSLQPPAAIKVATKKGNWNVAFALAVLSSQRKLWTQNLHERTPLYKGQFSFAKLPFLLFSTSMVREHLSLKDTLASQLGVLYREVLL
ncbi:hypothetical protein LAZ67_2001759 [Cordylochernes scorpioides]|uniref:Uncharacterized protein n=1 Tax=Cordylochernes scorpioides TaxID=51811 RepID=A0ABY6K1M4_9ARAC|nr:hypothetical protein LAZ67_2001759 [Cordylochernes scorpioides]